MSRRVDVPFDLTLHGNLFNICPEPQVREAIEMIFSYLKTSGITFIGSFQGLVFDGNCVHVASLIRSDDL